MNPYSSLIPSVIKAPGDYCATFILKLSMTELGDYRNDRLGDLTGLADLIDWTDWTDRLD